MPFKPGHKLSKGRPQGVPNKPTQLLEEIARQSGCNPFKVLMDIAAGNWEALGYKQETLPGTDEPRISLDQRSNAAKEACKYLFPQRKAVEVSNAEGEGFRVIVEDFRSK